jgi:putative endonuclease
MEKQHLSNEIYKGCTNDLDKRLAKHQQGEGLSTSNNLPVYLVCSTAFLDKDRAFKFEKYLKKRIGKSIFK